MAININREVEDTFYRYKMPKLTAKVEGKGNGIKTVIVNVSDIAKALYRKPIYVTKFFGCELGAQVYVDEKNERYIVNGAHEASKLQELLDGFIKKFVLCQGCGNPETTLHVKRKSGVVATTCKACGSQGQLDVAHRLTQFIIKNPPESDATPASKAKSKKGKKSKNGHDQNSDEDHDGNAAGGDETSRHSPVMMSKEADEEEDWGEDTTEEAQLQRMNELSAMAKSLALSVDVEKSETERADVFFKHLSQFHEQDEVVTKRREIRQEADRLSLGPRAVLVLAEVLLSKAATIVTDIKKYHSVFVLFTRFGDQQKRAQHYVLGAMAKIIERFGDEALLTKSCHILKALYDCDIVEEEVILAWHAKGPSKKFVSKELSAKILSLCAPMVKWLKEAEEEDSGSSSTDEEEDESRDVPSECPPDVPYVNGRHADTPPSGGQTGSQEDSASDEDIDIDAI